ncbi:MAG: transposase [Pseudoruminococcus massiliensis]|uniref:transposase n=1 Tax=Pseudoruminococcus massiliensis TaxID=2086583 RepID=UPI00399227AF
MAFFGIIFSIFSEIWGKFSSEGCNNKIKVLKRNAYSYRNFKRFATAFYICFSINISIL